MHFLLPLDKVNEFNIYLFGITMWAEEQANDPLIGVSYEGYEILQVAGSGTFGKVYKVRETKTGTLLAMKHVFQNKKYKNRELDIMKQIESSYVVKLHHFFYKEQESGVFLNLVMEYIPDPLNRIIKRNLPYKKYIPTPTIIKYARCLLTALRDLHKNSICHRDIKPSNILVNEEEAKLCDFGSAKVLTANQKNIAYICSRYYRAPQLLLGAIYYTEKVDIWSIGCVIAQMITNHVLFEGTNTTSMLSKIIKCIGPPTDDDIKAMNIEEDIGVVSVEGTGLRNRMLKLNPQSPEQLVCLLEKMLVYNPNRRISAAQALSLPLFN